MDSIFYIVFTLTTGQGPENFARFYIGDDKEKAYSIFRQLKGSTEVNDSNVLSIEFMETQEGLPVNLKVLSCTLDQLADNCKIITRELFKHFNVAGR